MFRFIQSLESRTLLSSSANVAGDALQLGQDLTKIIADAKSARSTLSAHARPVLADLNRLHALTPALKGQVQSQFNSSKGKISAEVGNIISLGLSQGRNIPHELLRIFLDSGNAKRLASDHKALAADLAKLQAVETPLIAKLQTSVATEQAAVLGKVQPAVNANSGDAALQTHWSTLTAALTAANTQITGDYTALAGDLTTFVADLNA